MEEDLKLISLSLFALTAVFASSAVFSLPIANVANTSESIPERTVTSAVDFLRSQGLSGAKVPTLLIAQSSLKCGIPPIPPIGCKVGACICDRNGNNCQWTFVCN